MSQKDLREEVLNFCQFPENDGSFDVSCEEELTRMRFRIASLEWQLAQQIYTPFPRISNAAALPQEELRVGRDLLLLEERLRLMEASTSWRITAPLRFVKRLIGR